MDGFKKGQKVYHRNLGEGVFVGYDLHEGECIVEFADEFGYKDELRVSIINLNPSDSGGECV